MTRRSRRELPPGYAAHKSDHMARPHKVDVLTQIGAAGHALQEVALAQVNDRVRHCVISAARSDLPTSEAKLYEPNGALRRALRL